MRCENPIGKPFFELSEVDSSNNYAMRQVQARLAAHGTTWFAHFQNAGKGQRGKTWNAVAGENIIMSVVLEPSFLSIDNQFVLSASIALACNDFLKKYTVDKTYIKWPNDIYWEDRKAGGVLIENVLSGEKWKYAIVGIGLNINQTLFPNTLKNPVSLRQITGKTFNVIELAKELCGYLENRWKQLLTQKSEIIIEQYTSYLYKKDMKAIFKHENSLFSGIIRGINKNGELLLEKDGSVTPFSYVEWIIS